MLRRKRQIEGSVTVITGASSGIGRALARQLAQRGAAVVIAARSAGDLDEVAEECVSRIGADALAVPTDVGDEGAVHDLAHQALKRFGRVDSWVNNAGVIAYGEFERMPSAVFEQVIRTNLLGQIYGARAALAAFRKNGGGTLINMSSVWGRITAPYVVPYVVSKHGVRVFSESLRQGLRADRRSDDIRVCTILPESIDTPIFRHAANYAGRPVKPVPPVEDPIRVARTVLSCLERPRGEVTVGKAGHAVQSGIAVMPPALYSRLSPWLFDRTVFDSGEADEHPGNLFCPQPRLNQVDGGWRDHSPAARRRRAAVAALVGAPLIAAGVTAWRAVLRSEH